MKNLKFIAKILLFCFVLLETVSSIPQKHKGADGREYLIETELKYNWYKAFHECARRDYQLLIIDSAAKNKIIIDLLKKVIGKPENLWLGGNDEFSSSKDLNRPFYWSTTGQKFNFSYWSDNNPDNYLSQEHCVHIWANRPDFQWNDVGCTNTIGFICEINQYMEKYQNDFQNTCDAVKQTTTSITQDFNNTQQQQLSDMSLKLKKIGSLEEKFKNELVEWQNTTRISVQRVLDQQQKEIDQLSEEMFRQLSVLSAELKESTTNISTEFAHKLNDSLPFSINIRSFIVINQSG